MQHLLNQLLMILNVCRPLKEDVLCNNNIYVSSFQENLDACTDRLLSTFNSVVNESVRDTPIKDMRSPFNYYKYGVTLHGEIDLTHGTLHIPYIYRDGPIRFSSNETKLEWEIPVMVKDAKVRIIPKYEFNEVTLKKLHFHYSTRIWRFVQTEGNLSAMVDGLRAILKGQFDDAQGELDANTTIIEIGNLDVDFHSSYLKDLILGQLTPSVIYWFEDVILREAQEELNKFLQQRLKFINKDIKSFYRLSGVQIFLEKLAKASAMS